MSVEMYQGLAGQLEVFQPDADTSKLISEEVIHRELTSAAVNAGIDPGIIYAMDKTGMVLVAGKEDHWSKQDLSEWEAAIEEYDSLNAKEPS